MVYRLAFLGATAVAALSSAAAGEAASADLTASYADPAAVVVAVRASFPAAGGEVRAMAYENERTFLTHAVVKQRGIVGEDGVAILPFRGMKPGAYAFVAYYDANGDGRLNRGGVLGKPKEPLAFSNGVRPKLRKPHFDEVKVDVAPGSVVTVTLED